MSESFCVVRIGSRYVRWCYDGSAIVTCRLEFAARYTPSQAKRFRNSLRKTCDKPVDAIAITMRKIK